MTLFDYAAGFLLIASGLVGFVRGATREVTTVVAFVLAAVIAVFALRVSGPVAARMIHATWLADTAAILVVFVVAYLILRLVGGALTHTVRQTGLSGPDRLLGFAIGLVRGLVVLGGFVLLITAATPPERMPGWITTARLYPLSVASGDALKAFAPKGMKVAREVAPALQDAVAGEADDSQTDTTPKPAHHHHAHADPEGPRAGQDEPVEDPR